MSVQLTPVPDEQNHPIPGCNGMDVYKVYLPAFSCPYTGVEIIPGNLDQQIVLPDLYDLSLIGYNPPAVVGEDADLDLISRKAKGLVPDILDVLAV